MMPATDLDLILTVEARLAIQSLSWIFLPNAKKHIYDAELLICEA